MSSNDVIFGTPLPGAEAITETIGSAILAFASLDSSLDYYIRTVLQNEEIALRHVSGDTSLWFSETDKDYPIPLKRKLKHLVKLIRKIDSKKRYIALVEYVQNDLNKSILIRNCICHNASTIFAFKSKNNIIKLERDIQIASVFGFPVNRTIHFELNSLDMKLMTSMVVQAKMWLHHCVIEIMYDYGMRQRDEKRLFEPFPKGLWPHQFHSRPYPWQEDHPTHGITP